MRHAVTSAIGEWAAAQRGGPFTPGSDARGPREPGGEIVATGTAEVRGRTVWLLSSRSTGYEGETYTATRCAVALGSSVLPLRVTPRLVGRRTRERPRQVDDRAAFDRLYKIREGASHAGTTLPPAARARLVELRVGRSLGQSVRLALEGEVLTLSTDPEVAGPVGLAELVDAALAIAECIDARTPAA